IIVLVIVGSLVVRVWEGWRRTHKEGEEQERAEKQAMRERVTGGMVRGMPEVFGRFALWYGAESDPGRILWMVVSPEGRIEKSVKSPQEVLAYYKGLPAERRAEGMFVTMDLNHLVEPERARGMMTPHMLTLFEDAAWMRAHEQQVQALVEVCEGAGIPLWANMDIDRGGEQVRFRRLTR
ncbi:MAG: hypothetical protein NTY98_07025, partial [Verrucomicrobia bacterium]|nr:hypothetical protein [Verrucomicrobiota bacterium]